MMETNPYFYFITYLYNKDQYCNEVIHGHPFKWLATTKAYPGQYVLLHWRVITEDEYNFYQETFE